MIGRKSVIVISLLCALAFAAIAPATAAAAQRAYDCEKTERASSKTLTASKRAERGISPPAAP